MINKNKLVFIVLGFLLLPSFVFAGENLENCTDNSSQNLKELKGNFLKQNFEQKQQEFKKQDRFKKQELEKQRQEFKEEKKEIINNFKQKQEELKEKYKKQYLPILQGKIKDLPEEKIVAVINKIDGMIEKFKNTKITQEKKDRLISQLLSIKEILQESLSKNIPENINIDELFN